MLGSRLGFFGVWGGTRARASVPGELGGPKSNLTIKTHVANNDSVAVKEKKSQLPPTDYVCLTVSLKPREANGLNVQPVDEGLSLAGKKLDSAGLGLAIVRNIVNDYNGLFFTDCDDTTSTVFTVYFPVFDPISADQSPDNIDDFGLNHEKENGKILVIDDEIIILQMILFAR